MTNKEKFLLESVHRELRECHGAHLPAAGRQRKAIERLPAAGRLIFAD